jgi:hypothetical protein
MARQKDTRPKTTPTPVRFTEQMLEEIDEVAADLAMSRQDIIRLSVSAGLKALRSLGRAGLVERISQELTRPEIGIAADEPTIYKEARRAPAKKSTPHKGK